MNNQGKLIGIMKDTNLILKEFPTHVPKTNNKIKANKYWKINSQSIYNGAIQRFTRAIVVNNIHSYILEQLKTQQLPKIDRPIQLQLDIYIPINYANIRRNKDGEISWKIPKDDYEPTNDEDNISWIWNKCIKDCLTKLKVWEDDTMYWCRGTSSLIYFVDNINDRRIEISFKQVK